MDSIASSPSRKESPRHASGRVDKSNFYFASGPLDARYCVVSIFTKRAVLIYLHSIDDEPRRVRVEYPDIQLDKESAP